MINLIMTARPELQISWGFGLVLLCVLAWTYRKEILDTIRYF